MRKRKKGKGFNLDDDGGGDGEDAACECVLEQYVSFRGLDDESFAKLEHRIDVRQKKAKKHNS